MKELLLNVSELPAPEPFEQIMQALTTMHKDQYLKVIHRKQPLLLYKPLQELGYQFHVQSGEELLLDIYIWKKTNKPPSCIKHPCLANLDIPNKKCSDC